MTAVLFTCAGQRVDIVSAFTRAGATTVAADADRLAPTLYHADRLALVPRIDDPRTSLRSPTSSASTTSRLVVPLTDLDQVLLSRSRDDAGAGARARPRARSVRRWATSGSRTSSSGARASRARRSWLPATCRTTPATRCSSRCARASARGTSIAPRMPSSSRSILGDTPVESFVQQLCRGEEFSIDVFCDLDGRCLNAIPRTMIQSKGGESIKGTIDPGRELIEHGRRVAETIGIVGPANIQCFREPDGSLPVTDVNPRFGGAFPLPLAAGGRYPELALALARGERPEPRLGDFREGVVMTRFFSDLCLVEDATETLVPFAEELPSPIAVEPGETS